MFDPQIRGQRGQSDPAPPGQCGCQRRERCSCAARQDPDRKAGEGAAHSSVGGVGKPGKQERTAHENEALDGVPFCSLVEGGKQLRWSSLRHWLHDIALELWEGAGDETLGDELSLDYVWITTQGRAVLLDEPWPDVAKTAECITIGDVAGQQRFLDSIASCAESTSLPIHARPIIQNLADGKFEKLSFLTGTLRGLLERPCEVSRGIRAGSIFMLGFYVWAAVVVGRYHDKQWNVFVGEFVAVAGMLLGGIALIQLLELAIGSTVGQFIFRLAVVDEKGKRAGIKKLFARWTVIWIPLFLLMSLGGFLLKMDQVRAAFILAVALLVLWIGAAVYAVINPNRGLHDKLAGTWVVRQ